MIFKEKNFVSAVVYVRNDMNEINSFLTMLYNVLKEKFEKFEIICVNDCSKDNSKEVVLKFADSIEDCILSIVNMSYWQGVEAAMHAGVDLAIGDFVFEFDSIVMDYEPNLIMQVYNRSLQGFDIVSCGKSNMRFSSRLFYFVFNQISDAQLKLKSETFRILSRRAINRVHSMSAHMPYRKALYSNCGLKTDFIGYTSMDAGKKRKQKRAFKNPGDTAFTTLILFTDAAYRISVFFSIMMSVFMFGFGLFTVIVYFSSMDLTVGWAPLMGLLSAGFCGVFIVLTIIIKYIDTLLKGIFNRQAYLISSIDK